MRVLWLTPELPYAPGGTGGSTRQFHLLRALAERGHDVDGRSRRCTRPGEGAALLRATGVRLLRDRATGVAGCARRSRALRARPRLLAARRARPGARVAGRACSGRGCGRCAARRSASAARRGARRARLGRRAGRRDLPRALPRALDAAEPVVGATTRRAPRAAGGLRVGRARAGGSALRALRPPARSAATTCCWRCPSSTARRSRAVTSARCEVVPNGVDTGRDAGAPSPRRTPLAALHRHARPTRRTPRRSAVAAARASGRACAPRSHRRRLAVVGPRRAREARRLADDDVELAGWVPDMRPWFARASVVLVPMRSGGGTRLKVLDGLASGRAMVSTTMGAEGIDAPRRRARCCWPTAPRRSPTRCCGCWATPRERARLGGARARAGRGRLRLGRRSARAWAACSTGSSVADGAADPADGQRAAGVEPVERRARGARARARRPAAPLRRRAGPSVARAPSGCVARPPKRSVCASVEK